VVHIAWEALVTYNVENIKEIYKDLNSGLFANIDCRRELERAAVFRKDKVFIYTDNELSTILRDLDIKVELVNTILTPDILFPNFVSFKNESGIRKISWLEFKNISSVNPEMINQVQKYYLAYGAGAVFIEAGFTRHFEREFYSQLGESMRNKIFLINGFY
jgi:hypothetical protein